MRRFASSRGAGNRPVAALIAVLLLGGCAGYETFDSQADLRQRYIERLGPELGGGVEVPYQLSEEVLSALEGRVNPSSSEKLRTNEVLDFVFGWLNLQYALTPTRNAVDTFKLREGNCLSFVNLFVGASRQYHLNSFYVEVEDYQRWNYRDGVVLSQGHIVGGMYVDGELSTFDFLPYTPKSYRDLEPIDDLAAAAHFYNNLGAEELIAGDVRKAEELLTAAYRMAPDFAKAINNLGLVYLRTDRVGEAVALYDRGLEIDPESVALLTNKARAFQQLGRIDEAMDLLARIEDAGQTNPYFFIYRAEVALARGDTETALDYMREALRRDSELPEVHVGLAKVFLATGDLERARHHVERALKLDATHEEARRYAAMVLGPGGAHQ